jgi:hypothetical protein
VDLLHLRSRSFQHFNAKILVIVDSSNCKAAAAATVTTASLANLAIEFVLEPKNRQCLKEPAMVVLQALVRHQHAHAPRDVAQNTPDSKAN